MSTNDNRISQFQVAASLEPKWLRIRDWGLYKFSLPLPEGAEFPSVCPWPPGPRSRVPLCPWPPGPRCRIDDSIALESSPPCPWRPGISPPFPLFPLPPLKMARPDTTPNPSLIGLRMKISVSSIDPCPPFRARRPAKGGARLATKKWSHFYISEPPPRAWSRITGVENSLK